MNAFDCLEDVSARMGAPPWHQDPRDDDPRDEDARQAAFLRQAHILCPGVDIFAVPNAGRRSRWEANKRRREGMKAGALDLVATWRGGIAFLEFKDGKSQPDANQSDRLAMYARQGHPAGVFRQERSALEWLRSLGAPFIDRRGAL